MKNMSNLVNSFSDSSADVVGVGKGVSGVFVKQEPEEVEEVSFAYGSPNDNINVIEGGDSLPQFSRSVTVPKEAFDKVVNANVITPFAAVFRFLNMTSDEKNSTVLGNEVLAVEMGTGIANLTNKIRIRFCNIKYEGTPSCCSWNGEGSRPTWTHDGCRTNNSGENITCECSHLTFFAILLAPVNETISSNDLNTLTIITKVGCGISMFFLGLILFIHILIRKTKSRISTRILIHLVSAMFLLNLTFLTNSYVANMKSDVGCKIMAALMHYFMLATFTWFAVQAFHFSLQLYSGRGITIRHYILKVCIISWLLPSVIAIVLISIGKYGEQQINSSDTKDTVAMCWITDNDVHYIVNIGYYALVFIFTLTAFITIVTWLCCLKRARNGTAQTSTNGKNMVNILGLCCILGVTWGFAFFANGVLRIPSYYIFTVLNSFQGFFLFIYYYKSSHSKEMTDGTSDQSSSNTSAIKTSVESLTNPYINMSYNKRSPQITNGDQIVVKGSA
ncbi:adhesion G-protein coupled receptor G2-like [Plectropomus leopardus]|uniref:adhesion G-protein coupled receptor G2-like n=1 Tax=Plectropomus leopardus TaxID=160734 RepID=UPI001C4AE432|nr:adhesion G-protein coupled receptor G2-like [Plectropomus leopardus]